jgi:hypothetical protein
VPGCVGRAKQLIDWIKMTAIFHRGTTHQRRGIAGADVRVDVTSGCLGGVPHRIGPSTGLGQALSHYEHAGREPVFNMRSQS